MVLVKTFRANQFALDAGDDDFEVARAAVSRILGQAVALADFEELWDHIDLPSGIPRKVMPTPISDGRRCKLEECSERLNSLDEDLSQGDLVRAMDLADATFRSMGMRFEVGSLEAGWEGDLTEDEAALQRFMCAATLPLVADLLNDKWMPVRARLKLASEE